MLKKFLLVIIIVLIIIFSILLIREYKLTSEVYLEETSFISQNDIIELLNKGSNYTNYYRNIETQNGVEEYYYKDNILVYYINSELKYWMNLNENEREMIIIDDSNEKIAKIVENFKEINFPQECSQLGYYSNIYDTENVECNYLGKIYYNNRPTLVVKTFLNNKFKLYEYKYYIDEETGVIVKRIDIQKNTFITMYLQEFDRGIKFDTVTDNDIKKPNLQEYSVEQCSFPVLTIW